MKEALEQHYQEMWFMLYFTEVYLSENKKQQHVNMRCGCLRFANVTLRKTAFRYQAYLHQLLQKRNTLATVTGAVTH